MKATITINGTEREVMLTILPSGYGHNKITANWFDGNERITHSVVTNATQLTDAMRSEDDERSEEACEQAAEMVTDNYYESK